MWNEHCSYKSSRIHLRGLPTKAPWVIQGPGENAGVIDIGDGLGLHLQDGEPQPPLLHRALSGRGDGRRRHPARRVHHGRAARSRRSTSCASASRIIPKTAPSRLGRGRRHRRLRQFLRRADRRRQRGLPPALQRQHPRQRHGGRPRAHRRDLLRRGDGRREPDRLSRLQDRPRRHPRRHHGVGRVRRRVRGEAPDRAGRRSLRREAPARGLPRAHEVGRGHRDPGHGRGGPHLLRRRDGRQGRSRRRARPRQGALPRGGHDAPTR